MTQAAKITAKIAGPTMRYIFPTNIRRGLYRAWWAAILAWVLYVVFVYCLVKSFSHPIVEMLLIAIGPPVACSLMAIVIIWVIKAFADYAERSLPKHIPVYARVSGSSIIISIADPINKRFRPLLYVGEMSGGPCKRHELFDEFPTEAEALKHAEAVGTGQSG